MHSTCGVPFIATNRHLAVPRCHELYLADAGILSLDYGITNITTINKTGMIRPRRQDEFLLSS